MTPSPRTGASSSSPARRGVDGLLFTLPALYATLVAWRLSQTALATERLPLWDEAKYGLDGSQVAGALRSGRILDLVQLLYGMDDWPPLFPLAESLAVLAAGDTYATPRLLVSLLVLLAALTILWTGHTLEPASPVTAVFAGAVFLLSPMTRLFGSLAMLEIPGSLLFLVCLAAYVRYLRTGERSSLVATCVSALLLFFCKFNYGLFFLVPLALNEAWIAAGSVKGALAALRSRLAAFDPTSPWHLFLVLYGLGLAVLAVTGGGTLTLCGLEVRATSMGNPLYLLALIVLARHLARPRHAWRRFWCWHEKLSERHRALLWLLVAPITVWLLLPPHLKNFVDFVESRSSDAAWWSAESLLFYACSFVDGYHVSPLLGGLALVLGLVGMRRLSRQPQERFLSLCLAVGLLAVTLHPYKLPRFFFLVALLLWLSAGSELAGAVGKAVQALAPALRSPALRMLGCLVVVLLWMQPVGGPSARSYRSWTARPEVGRVVDRIVQLTHAAPSTLVLGTWNRLSPALVQWRYRQLHPEAAEDGPEIAVPSRKTTTGLLLRRLSADPILDRIVLLDVVSPIPAYVEETSWLLPVRSALGSGGPRWRLVRSEVYPEAGYVLRVYDSRRASAASPGGVPAGE